MRYFIRHEWKVEAFQTSFPGDIAGKPFSSGDYLVDCGHGYIQSVPSSLFEQIYEPSKFDNPSYFIMGTSGVFDFRPANGFYGIGKIPHDDYGYWHGLDKPINVSC